MLKRLMKSEKGFTLVELMVVVIILGILVAIAIPIFNNVTGDAKANVCASNIRTINGAINMYYANEGKYPDDISDLSPYIKDPDNLKCPVTDSTYELAGNGMSVDESDHDHATTTPSSSPSGDDT